MPGRHCLPFHCIPLYTVAHTHSAIVPLSRYLPSSLSDRYSPNHITNHFLTHSFDLCLAQSTLPTSASKHYRSRPSCLICTASTLNAQTFRYYGAKAYYITINILKSYVQSDDNAYLSCNTQAYFSRNRRAAESARKAFDSDSL